MAKLKSLSRLEQAFFKAFEDNYVQSVVVTLLKSASGGVFRAFLVGVIMDHFFDDVVEPFAAEMKRRRQYEIDVENGKIKWERVKNATDQNSHDSSIDDIFK